jgi:hypothetical protein
VSDLSHLWQRFLLASSLLVGLAIGAGATIFGYSNLGTVNVRWSVVHIDGVPLWTVAVVPLAVVLIAGTLYHWMDGLHHFTEHMRHRRRVHELEAEVASLRAHLDQVLDMPGLSTSKISPKRPAVALPSADDGLSELAPAETAETVEPTKPEPVTSEAGAAAEPSPEPDPVKENGSHKAGTPRIRSSLRRRVASSQAGGSGKETRPLKAVKAAEATAEAHPPTVDV